VFEVTGDGLPGLLGLHVHPWWLPLHGYRLRRVWIAQAGMRVVFVDCKGTDPGMAWQVTCAYRLANPGAIVGVLAPPAA
jgi:hypothetical protein